MRVLKKRKIRVRRLGSQQTKWLWYYKGRKRWYQYGEKVCNNSGQALDRTVFCWWKTGDLFGL